MTNAAFLGLLAALLAAVSVIVTTWLYGSKRGTLAARASAAPRLAAMRAERDAAERRAADSAAEVGRWKGMSLAGSALSSSPIFDARPAPRDAEELARMVRGLAFVDDVALADRSGYPLTREASASSPDLAALAPTVHALVHTFTLATLQVTDLHIETADALHVRARLLSGRCEGAMLFVQSTSQPVSALVMDAVGHASARSVVERHGRSLEDGAWVSTDREAEPESLSQESIATLDRELSGSLAAVVLVLGGKTVFSSSAKGPRAEVRAAAADALLALAARVRSALRATGIARVEVQLRGGGAVVWSSLPGRSGAALVTFSRADTRSASRLDVLVGKLCRALDTKDASLEAQGTAA